MKYSYSYLRKLIFYISYFYYKITIFADCKKGTLKIYKAEILWTFSSILNVKPRPDSNKLTNNFQTRFGKFTVPADRLSTITVSPAFERLDVNFLLKEISSMYKNKEKVLFIDVGANFGLYTVIVGNKFKKKSIDIIAFEPNTTYLTSPTFALLKKNVKQNKLKKVKIYKKGIGSKNSIKNKIGISTVRLESVLKKSYLQKFDTVVYKIDVDDFVMDVLKGIEKSVENSNKALLLVEDFVDKKSIKYLDKKYKFITKLTAYNSFWEKNE